MEKILRQVLPLFQKTVTHHSPLMLSLSSPFSYRLYGEESQEEDLTFRIFFYVLHTFYFACVIPYKYSLMNSFPDNISCFMKYGIFEFGIPIHTRSAGICMMCA